MSHLCEMTKKRTSYALPTPTFRAVLATSVVMTSQTNITGGERRLVHLLHLQCPEVRNLLIRGFMCLLISVKVKGHIHKKTRSNLV